MYNCISLSYVIFRTFRDDFKMVTGPKQLMLKCTVAK